jgi:hypothetical protein
MFGGSFGGPLVPGSRIGGTMQKGAQRLAVTLLSLSLLTGAASVAAQTSRALLRSSEEERYLAFKRTFQAMVDQGTLGVAVPRSGGAVDLKDCSLGHDFLGPEAGEGASSRTRQLADLAYEIVRLKKLMARLGYPEAVWRPMLVDNEERGKESFDPIEGTYLEGLSQTLNAYRRQSAPALPATLVEGGCGEGEVAIRIATRPGNGRVRLIPVFFFKLCEVQKIDPDDPRRCDHWREPAEGALFEVSGDYNYQASWPDGARRSGMLSFTRLEYGQTVTIGKP